MNDTVLQEYTKQKRNAVFNRKALFQRKINHRLYVKLIMNRKRTLNLTVIDLFEASLTPYENDRVTMMQ